MNGLFNKTLSVFVLIAFVSTLTFGFFLQPKKAEAGWPTTVIADIQGALKWTWEKIETVWDKLDKKYRDIIVRIIIAKMQMDIIRSIEGVNLYVSDWGGFLKDTVTELVFNEFNEYVRKASDGEVDLCVPYSAQLMALSLVSLGLASGVGQQYYGLPIRCTFDEFKANLQNTYDFVQRGGWAAYDIAFSPGANPYWMAWRLEDSIVRRTAEEKEKKKTEAESSGGYLGNKTCLESEAGTREEVVAICSDPDLRDEGETQQECVDSIMGSKSGNKCLREGIITPGTAVADSVMSAIGGDFDYAANVQSAIAAIVNAFVGKIIRKGLASGASQSSDSYGIEEGDLTGSGFEGFEGERHEQDLKDAQEKYDDTLYYLNNDLIPAVQRVLALIQQKNLESCAATLPSAEIDEGGGTQKTYTITDLIALVRALDAVSVQAGQEAETNRAEIDSLLADTAATEEQIIDALTRYDSFYKTYKVIMQDVESVSAGQDGSLLIVLDSVYNALSADEIFCPALPSTSP